MEERPGESDRRAASEEPGPPAQTVRGPSLVAARVAAGGLLLVLTALVLWPFLTALVWGAILAYVTWPLWRRFPGRTRHPALAAVGLTVLVGVGIGIPVALILLMLADEVTSLAQGLLAWRETGLPVPPVLAENPLVRRVVEMLQEAPFFDRARAALGSDEWMGSVGSEVSRRIVAVAGGIVRNAVRFGVAMVSLYAFYLSGERLAEIGRRLAPLLFPEAPLRFVESIGEAVRAVMFGLLGTALAQGILGGIALAVAGVPNPVVLGAATAVLSVLPGGGGAILLASAAWLAFAEHYVAAVGLALWSVLVVSSMDNVLRPLLISGRGQIPFLLVFLGVLGGLGSFGLLGAFVGPVILSVTFALVVEFSRISSRAPEPDPEAKRAQPSPPAGP